MFSTQIQPPRFLQHFLPSILIVSIHSCKSLHLEFYCMLVQIHCIFFHSFTWVLQSSHLKCHWWKYNHLRFPSQQPCAGTYPHHSRPRESAQSCRKEKQSLSFLRVNYQAFHRHVASCMCIVCVRHHPIFILTLGRLPKLRCSSRKRTIQTESMLA